jgi:hypothetical protein
MGKAYSNEGGGQASAAKHGDGNSNNVGDCKGNKVGGNKEDIGGVAKMMATATRVAGKQRRRQ